MNVRLVTPLLATVRRAYPEWERDFTAESTDIRYDTDIVNKHSVGVIFDICRFSSEVLFPLWVCPSYSGQRWSDQSNIHSIVT